MHETTAKVLEAIEKFWKQHHYGPSYQDIVKMAGLSSPCIAYYHVQKLKRMGRVNTTPHTIRAIVLVKE